MRIEIDQSGKVEETNRPTVLAFANTKKYAIKIPARVKRDFILYMRSKGKKGKETYLTIFVVGLYLLIKKFLPKIQLITIDAEYPGQEVNIKNKLCHYFQKHLALSIPPIYFTQIGKQSNAHIKAYRTFKGEIFPDRQITLEELLSVIGPTKKIGAV